MGYMENFLEQNESWRARAQVRGGFHMPREAIVEPELPYDWTQDPDFAVQPFDAHARLMREQNMSTGAAGEATERE